MIVTSSMLRIRIGGADPDEPVETAWSERIGSSISRLNVGYRDVTGAE